MVDTFLDEHEFELVNIIGSELAKNQRDLSRRMNLSLGMTNMLLRRLVAKGCIRIQQLDQRKVQYILTPKGFTEKYRKSIKYTLKTIQSIGLIRRQLDAIVARLYAEGERVFFIVGTSDLAELTEMSLRQPQWTGVKVQRVEGVPPGIEGLVLVCREQEEPAKAGMTGRQVDMLEELAK